MDILSFAIGAVVGALILWLILRRGIVERARLQERKLVLEERARQLNDELSRSRETVINLSSQLSAAKADTAHYHQLLETERAQLQEMQKTMTSQFKGIADSLLLESTRQIQDQHKEKLNDVLGPFTETMNRFEKKIDENQKESVRENQSLKEQLLALQKLNQSIGEEAKNLTTALKGQSKTQGGWGEVILERILEKSGLCRGREFTVQGSHLTEEGRRLQPDVVVHLPENKNLVIDSKVSLSSFERYCNCDDAERQETELKEHVASVRRHVKELAAKSYQRLYGLPSLDFVLMFIPVEPAFNEAVQADPDLYTEAFEQNIIIVSTSTLLATLRTIASIWRQENQNRNAMEIARLGGELYDKVAGFVDDLLELGRKMKSAQDSFDDAISKLSKGRGNVLRRAEELKKLGAKTSKDIEKSLTDGADPDAP